MKRCTVKMTHPDLEDDIEVPERSARGLALSGWVLEEDDPPTTPEPEPEPEPAPLPASAIFTADDDAPEGDDD